MAAESDLELELGVKGKHGILHNRQSRTRFLIEIFLSILVRKLLKRGSFTSVAGLEAKVLSFLDYYNRTMAKPFKWTYEGKPPVP